MNYSTTIGAKLSPNIVQFELKTCEIWNSSTVDNSKLNFTRYQSLTSSYRWKLRNIEIYAAGNTVQLSEIGLILVKLCGLLALENDIFAIRTARVEIEGHTTDYLSWAPESNIP